MVMEINDTMSIEQIETRLKEIKKEREILLHNAKIIDGAFLSSYEIRPTGKHLLTIGEELIQDQFAAILELVKNCYDADSPDAKVCFKKIPEKDFLEIRIEDSGHGMSTEDVISKWLVPSTNYKKIKRVSPKGRIMQGRKGIGRYAASILGEDLKLVTIDRKGQKTIVYINWTSFTSHEYLDQVDVPIITEVTEEKAGTKLIIHSKLSKNTYWKNETLNELRFELKKLIPPKADNAFDNDFKIWLYFESFSGCSIEDGKEEILPFPILELYDYRVSGIVNANGEASLSYENQKLQNGVFENFKVDYSPTGCGTFMIDIRVYDRDKDALELLIQRGLVDGKTGKYVSQSDARKLLNDVNGIGVYRNGFRIRPLGDADFDWLKLNEERIQNPSLRIGSNQVVGYVLVESEEVSGLEEKSARDGLKNNFAYNQLKKISREVISELEKRRFIFRRKMELLKPSKKVEHQLNSLYDYTKLVNLVSGSLRKAGMSEDVINEVSSLISDEEKRKNQTVDEIRNTVAIYQGQATLGRIINIVLHEGRRPLNYFKNQIPNLRFYADRFKNDYEINSVEKIINLTSGLADNASIFSSLFSRLDPLAARRRETKKTFSIKETLLGVMAVFEGEFEEKGISVHLNCNEKIMFTGWKQDFYSIFTNLIDNSIFWINEKKQEERTISINVSSYENRLLIDYIDSGPGINDDLLISGVIFDPEFTTKPPGMGTGLGLSIAGEAATRNQLTLIAVQNEKGVHFKLKTDGEE
jgi:signal transduction histidine kinase